MAEVKFKDIAARLSIPNYQVTGTTLRVANMPTPFVPPTFEIADLRLLDNCNVLLIRASAAVGKTTLARALSAERNIPILDLAKIAVATGSLVGILNGLQGTASAAIQAFHNGTAPLLVDALDEGRLHSGDNGLFSFIDTSADLIMQSTRNDKVKLIMLGRSEAIDYAELYLSEKNVPTATLDVGFFDEEEARQLVHAYAEAEAKAKNITSYFTFREPADKLIRTYFNKIACALELSPLDLWKQSAGRSFAGYAPVLAAIGSLLPNIDNFLEAQNRLNEVGTNSAWGVIESVLESIVVREKGKVCDQLLNAGLKSSITEVYSRNEQISFLMQTVQHLPLSGSGRLSLSGQDATKYFDQVHRFLPDHPFLKDSKFSNDVIASYVVADAIINDFSIIDDFLLRRLARQPFLWRSLKSCFGGDTVLEGKYLGYVLSSFWSDPLTVDESVIIHDMDDGGGSYVKITLKGEKTEFTSTTPLHFYGQMRNVQIRTSEPLTLVSIGDGSTCVFSLSGKNDIAGEIIDLRATELRLRSGATWLDAQVKPTLGPFKLYVEERAEYGWGESLSSTFPFSMYASNISRKSNDDDDVLVQMLSDCALRAPAGTSITIIKDYAVSENDYLGNVYLKYGEAFKTLIKSLVQAGYAKITPIPASGTSKVQVRLKVPFAALKEAAQASDGSEIASLMDNIRQRL